MPGEGKQKYKGLRNRSLPLWRQRGENTKCSHCCSLSTGNGNTTYLHNRGGQKCSLSFSGNTHTHSPRQGDARLAQKVKNRNHLTSASEATYLFRVFSHFVSRLVAYHYRVCKLRSCGARRTKWGSRDWKGKKYDIPPIPRECLAPRGVREMPPALQTS